MNIIPVNPATSPKVSSNVNLPLTSSEPHHHHHHHHHHLSRRRNINANNNNEISNSNNYKRIIRPRSESCLLAGRKRTSRTNRHYSRQNNHHVQQPNIEIKRIIHNINKTMDFTSSNNVEGNNNAELQLNSTKLQLPKVERDSENLQVIRHATEDTEAIATVLDNTFVRGTEARNSAISRENAANRSDSDSRARVSFPQLKSYKSSSTQTVSAVLYRLRFFPTLKNIVDEEKPPDLRKPSKSFRCIQLLGRIFLCQFGLLWFLTIWAFLGAVAFYVTEGPREHEQVYGLKDMQKDLAVSLSTDLKNIKLNNQENEMIWAETIRQYVARHEKMLLAAIGAGYGEANDGGELWTFSGCVLFSIAVLTTLGFGAPVPRTSSGRSVAVVFATIGIPAHFLLMLNFGLVVALKIKRFAISKKYPHECNEEPDATDTLPIPKWVKKGIFISCFSYYVLGVICFGVARNRAISESLLFPLDFTVAGGLSTIAGFVRVFYGFYLEGAVILAAIVFALLKVSATQSFTNIGLKYGLLTYA